MKKAIFALAVALQVFSPGNMPALAHGSVAEGRQVVHSQNSINHVASQSYSADTAGRWGYLVLSAWLLSLVSLLPRKQRVVIPWKSVAE